MDLKTAEFILKVIASLIALIGSYLAIMKYLEEKRKANLTARTESQKPFSAKQQEIYFDLVSTTALISTSGKTDPAWAPAVDHFWVLFWGPVPMVADQGVSKMVDVFSVALDNPDDEITLRNASMDLARACRLSLGEAWKIGLQDYPKTKAGTAK
jgi:hypothetical protein